MSLAREPLPHPAKAAVQKAADWWTPDRVKFKQWYETAEYLRSPRRQKELAEALGVSVKSLQRWEADPRFHTALFDTLRNRARNSLPGIFETMLHRAESGDHQAALTVFAVAGFATETRQASDTNINVGVGVRIQVEYVNGDD